MNSPKEPQYRRIADELRKKLLEMQPEEPFDTELALAEQYRVSRGTIRQALSVLEAEGLLSREQGRGTFRSETKETFVTFRLPDDMIEAVRKPRHGGGGELKKLSVTVVSAPHRIAEVLGIPHGSKVRRVTRVRTIGGAPYVLCTAYVRTDIIPPFTRSDITVSLTAMAKDKFDLTTDVKQILFHAAAADAVFAEALAIPAGSPVLQIGVLNVGKDGVPLYTDTFTFPATQTLCMESFEN